LTLLLVAVSLAIVHRVIRSPFGRVLTTVRDNPERAAFIGVNVRLYQLTAFVVAGGLAGLAGALYGIFNRGVFADYVFWSKSAEIVIMTILGGVGYFWGPPVGAAVLVWLNQVITDYTQYWSFVLGTILLVLLFGFPGASSRPPACRRPRPTRRSGSWNALPTNVGWRCSSPNTTWKSYSRSRRRSPCCTRAVSSPKGDPRMCAATLKCGGFIWGMD
jgi:MFS family permease